MSGLVGARILKDTGFAVEVVEARKHLGGRIWTDTSLGVPCDMGASWIHGARHNPFTLWCRSLGVNTVRVPTGKTWFFKEGKSYPLSRALWIARRGTRAAYAYIRASLARDEQNRGLDGSGKVEDIHIL
ncbi:MAG: FAD-dependent oxidoreductase, partial [Deltaproteobacteria bacterium]